MMLPGRVWCCCPCTAAAAAAAEHHDCLAHLLRAGPTGVCFATSGLMLVYVWLIHHAGFLS